MRYLTDDAERSVQGRFHSAIRREHGRDLALPLDPDTRSDFSRALVNIDMILTAVADESVDAYWSAVRVAGEASNHVVDELLACDLYQMWVELSDLYEFTEEGSAGENDVVLVMRQAASVAGSAEERSIRAPGLLRPLDDRTRPRALARPPRRATLQQPRCIGLVSLGECIAADRARTMTCGWRPQRAIWRAVRRRTWGC